MARPIKSEIEVMQRVALLLPPKLKAKLTKLGKSTGLPVNEHIRRALEEYLK